jgi:hypothetical protein
MSSRSVLGPTQPPVPGGKAAEARSWPLPSSAEVKNGGAIPPLPNVFVAYSVAVVRKRTILTERPLLVGEVSANLCGKRVLRGQRNEYLRPLISVFLDRSRYFYIQVAHQLSSRGWVDPIPDPLLLRKSGMAENRTRDLWFCSQKLWPLDHRELN